MIKDGINSNFPALTEIGARIRMIRRQRGMTQSQLVGEELTRNMLSRIENGAALPSLPTLCHIASRLDVPVGALLGDLGDYAGWQLSRDLRRLISQKKYDRVIERCNEAGHIENGSEIAAILCEAYTERAYVYYEGGHLSSALQYLEAAERIAEKQPPKDHRTDMRTAHELHELAERIFLLRTLISACPALYPAGTPQTIGIHEEKLRSAIFDDNGTAIYLYCLSKLGDLPRGAYSQPHELSASLRSQLDALITALDDELYRVHIDAKLHMINADYLDAKAKLLKILAPDIPPAIRYDILADIEFCCKCCGDFENAYKYSGQRLELGKRIN